MPQLWNNLLSIYSYIYLSVALSKHIFKGVAFLSDSCFVICITVVCHDTTTLIISILVSSFICIFIFLMFYCFIFCIDPLNDGAFSLHSCHRSYGIKCLVSVQKI